MYRLKIGFLAFFLSFLAIFSSEIMAAFATSIEAEKNKVEDLKKQKKEEEEKLEELKEERGKIEEEITALDKEAEGIVDELQTLGKKIDNNKKNLSHLEKEILNADSLKKKHYTTMKKRVKYIYENGEANYFDIFTGSKNIEEILNKAEYVSEIAEYDSSLLDRYLLAKTTAEDKKKQKEIELTNLETNKALVDNELLKNKAVAYEKELRFKKYNKLIKDSGAVITQFSGEIEEKEAQIDKLIAIEEQKRKEREERERQRKLALEKQNQGNIQVRPKISKSGFAWPLPGYSYISSGFGYRGVIIKGSGSFHRGIDIPAPIGTTIVASLDGTVARAGYSTSMGNFVLINHGDGLYTVYMHASKLLVSSGSYVSKGQAISLVGSTGFSTGPHLHFGVQVNGAYQNPLNYVSN